MPAWSQPAAAAVTSPSRVPSRTAPARSYPLCTVHAAGSHTTRESRDFFVSVF